MAPSDCISLLLHTLMGPLCIVRQINEYGEQMKWYWTSDHKSASKRTCPSAILCTTNPTAAILGYLSYNPIFWTVRILFVFYIDYGMHI